MNSHTLESIAQWECGTPRSTNNDFTATKPPKRYAQSKKLRLTKLEQSAVALMDADEAKAYRAEIRRKRGLT